MLKQLLGHATFSSEMKEQGVAQAERYYAARALRKLYIFYRSQQKTPFFAQFAVPNFQKQTDYRCDFREKLSRQLLRFLASTPSYRPPGRRRSPGGRNDLPRRQTASESFSLQPTHLSWQTDPPYLFWSLSGTPAKDTTRRIDATALPS